MFRRFRRLFSRRRYHDAAYSRPDLRRRTEAGGWERFVRIVRRREVFGYDEREAKAGSMIRILALGGLSLVCVWFLIRSLSVLNIFAG